MRVRRSPIVDVLNFHYLPNLTEQFLSGGGIQAVHPGLAIERSQIDFSVSRTAGHRTIMQAAQDTIKSIVMDGALYIQVGRWVAPHRPHDRFIGATGVCISELAGNFVERDTFAPQRKGAAFPLNGQQAACRGFSYHIS